MLRIIAPYHLSAALAPVDITKTASTLPARPVITPVLSATVARALTVTTVLVSAPSPCLTAVPA